MNNVIYVYSFSLTFSPGLSLAFIVADKEVIRSLSYIVSVRFVATDWMTQKLMARYLEDGTYYRNIEIFKYNYRQKRDLVCDHLDALSRYGVSYVKPRGGVYIWCRLPEGVDCKKFTDKAFSRDLLIIPGYIFYPYKSGGREYVRINYSFEKMNKIEEGMKVFDELIRESV
jgi:DNA-binding transcriptional MocR family regulator